jgi:tetratricopeptide (TPR) repeat protein
MPTSRAKFLRLALPAALLFLAPATARAGDAYEDAMAQAAALEQQGRLGEAARVIEAVLPDYPQDMAIVLELVWIHYRAGDFEAAARLYETALSRSSGALDARLGLGLSLERLGRCKEAVRYLLDASRERPDLSAPREALDRCEPRSTWSITPAVSLTGLYYSDHPDKALAGGPGASLGITEEGGWFLRGNYQYLHFTAPASAQISAWDQHEGYFSAGYSGKLFGVGLTYGIVHDGSGALGTSHHAGVSLRASPFGDLGLDASASFYTDLTVLRFAPSWRIPIAGGFSVRPGGAVQWAGGEWLATGTVTLALDRPTFSLFAGGKYGDELRPAYLTAPVVYDTQERIPYGLWAGASVNAGAGVRIHATYSMDRLKREEEAITITANAHALTIGAGVSF